MNGFKPGTSFFISTILNLLILSGTALADLRVTWSRQSLNTEIALGYKTTITVSFIAAETLKNVVIQVAPQLQPIVQVSPSIIHTIAQREKINLNLTISAAPNVSVGTFKGTIQLRREHSNESNTKKNKSKAAENENKSQLIVPPVPINILVTVVPLPTDPGDVGKTTLKGIDSDNDGIRDDVQRYTALTHPSSQKIRSALKQLAVPFQDLIRDANDKNATLNHAANSSLALDCLIYILGVDNAKKIFAGFRAELLNTPARSRQYIQANQQLSGEVFPLVPDDQLKLGCSFDPDIMEN